MAKGKLEILAVITLTKDRDDNLAVDVRSEVGENMLPGLLRTVADEIEGEEPPRAAGAWGFRG